MIVRYTSHLVEYAVNRGLAQIIQMPRILGHFSKQVHNQMRMLCIETDKSIQELLEEAVNALFTLHNKPPIA